MNNAHLSPFLCLVTMLSIPFLQAAHSSDKPKSPQMLEELETEINNVRLEITTLQEMKAERISFARWHNCRCTATLECCGMLAGSGIDSCLQTTPFCSVTGAAIGAIGGIITHVKRTGPMTTETVARYNRNIELHQDKLKKLEKKRKAN